MLRGRRSCVISGRPSPSPALKKPLSPIIPVHTRHSPVSPIIPVHAQKHGGGGLRQLSATSDQRPEGKRKADPSSSFCCSPLACPPQLQRGRATRHSLARRSLSGGGPLIPIISAPLATAALQVVPTPIFTTTSSIHCRRADNFTAARLRRRPVQRKEEPKNRSKQLAEKLRILGGRSFSSDIKCLAILGFSP